MSRSSAEFEEEVRRVARALWPAAAHGGAEKLSFDGVDREVDGIFRTEDVIHMVEATTDLRVEKIHNVGPKLRDHIVKNIAKGRFAKSWFITSHPPTADQRKILHEKYDRRIEILSYDQFRSKIVNARDYLKLRDTVGWGSAVNPLNNSQTALLKYVPLGILITSGVMHARTSEAAPSTRKLTPPSVISTSDLANALECGDRVALLGDYGAGKSMTLREVHGHLRDRYLRNESHRFPISLSLRRHYGQEDPAEAIQRHANYLGFPNPEKLVSAWRNGYVYVLLDGFDELAAPGWSGSPEALRENRREATILINQFHQETPDTSGVMVAGRRFYFDSMEEMGKSLFNWDLHVVASLSDFSEVQSRQFLDQFQEHGALPSWLPVRPLLLGHLAAEGLIGAVSSTIDLDPASGWDRLLDQISDRESFIRQGVDGPAVRKVIEQLASTARQTPQGVGPVTMRDIVDAFTAVRNQPPSDKELTLLQRLPGLGGEIEDAENGTRRFIDADLVSAAQAAAVTAFVIDPYTTFTDINPRKWTSSMEQLGIDVSAHQLAEKSRITAGQLRSALNRATRTEVPSLAADIVRVAMSLGFDLKSSESGLEYLVDGAVIPSLDLSDDDTDLSHVTFSRCLISELVIPSDSTGSIPKFINCDILTTFERLGEADMPREKFIDCEFAEFPDAVDRNSAILSSQSLPVGTRVVMKLLHQLYMQRGSGRKDSALTRGMPTSDAALVSAALQLLQQEGLVAQSRQTKSKVWMPDRSAGPRVRAFLNSPRAGNDPLVEASKRLGDRP